MSDLFEAAQRGFELDNNNVDPARAMPSQNRGHMACSGPARPLAERIRPQSFRDVAGQSKVRDLIERFHRVSANRFPNLVFWGPPGSGKTTVARLLAQHLDFKIRELSAINTGAKELKAISEQAKSDRLNNCGPSFIFIDEIHRLNSSQQDVLLPGLESGDLILIGATTENPSYELRPALLSRCRIVSFSPLGHEALTAILDRGLKMLADEDGLTLDLSSEACAQLLESANGDARLLLNRLEEVAWSCGSLNRVISVEDLSHVAPAHLSYDRKGQQHYLAISAFIKSVRGSDPDAAVYYLTRMLLAGEDPVFVARRLLILASEDIGNADPRALTLATSGLAAVEAIGMPEAGIVLSQVTVYLASAPKSNRSYQAWLRAQAEVQASGSLPIPWSLSADRSVAGRSVGAGVGYRYSHDGPRGFVAQNFLPIGLKNSQFYEPSDHGFEKNIKAYLAWLRNQPVATSDDLENLSPAKPQD